MTVDHAASLAQDRPADFEPIGEVAGLSSGKILFSPDRLLDGVAAPDGRPFLIMEYIEGTPIMEYCDGRSLRTRDRLELFRTVCSADSE